MSVAALGKRAQRFAESLQMLRGRCHKVGTCSNWSMHFAEGGIIMGLSENVWSGFDDVRGVIPERQHRAEILEAMAISI